jgi:cell division protein FtsB
MASFEIKRLFSWDKLLFVLGLILALKTALNIYTTYRRAGERMAEIENEVQTTQRVNTELKKQLEDTISFENIEKQAKDRFGMGKPNEVILVMPNQIVASNQLPVTSLPNWRKWWNLYLN